MPTETIDKPASQAVTAQAEKGDAKKSSNVKGPSVAQALLQREAALVAKKAPPAESVAEAAKVVEKAETSATGEAKQAAPETETKVEAKAPAEESDEALSKSSIPPELQEAIDKRIGKERAKRGELERKLAELEAKLAAVPTQVEKPAPVTPTAENPLANVNDIPELEKQLKTAKETKLWALEQLDREDIDQGIKVGDQTYTKAQLKAAVRNVEKLIEVHIPDRAKFLNQRANSEKLALDTFDWLKDPSTEQYKAFRKVISDPSLGFGALPNGIYAAAAAVEGQAQVQLRRAIAEQNKGTKAVEKKEPKAPASQLAGNGASAPAREAGNSRALAALASEMEQMKKGHGVKVSDVTKFLARRDQTHR